MKAVHLGSILFVLAMLLANCRKNDKLVPTLAADKTSLNVSAGAGKEYLQIDANTDWELTGVPAWLTVTPSSGKGNTKVELSYTANTTTAERLANLTLTVKGATGNTITIALQQAQADVIITSFTGHAIGGASITINGSGFDGTVGGNTVTINDKAATVTAATPTALTVTVPVKAGTGKIKVTAGTKNATSAGDFTYDWVYHVSTLAGDGTYSIFNRPYGLSVDAVGNAYVADFGANKIFKVTPAGVVTTIAGSGNAGAADGNGANAEFKGPTDVALDGNGNLYVADYFNNSIRKISPGGEVTTWAVDAGGAQLNSPTGLEVDGAGNLLVACHGTHKVIKIPLATGGAGAITTIAGTDAGYVDGPVATAKFRYPAEVSMDALGDIYVADQENKRVRRITASGNVSTIGGNGTAAVLGTVTGVAADAKGNVYVADFGNHRIQKITRAADGSYSMAVIAGGSAEGYADGNGASAKFINPVKVVLGSNGILYVAEEAGRRIRKMELQ
ncbi:BACON domain-containing carbohydrate-binding protein [Paraflavitalea sp. CAU 1676]|uniref:beta-propeller domain-containing protein n=1 Tax=Paraflavitalea sp. CAU 1676 TaxID=3032598 RepID=UPI0023DA7822|nr:BACON domain-containing carbohydrate-binding protein [Paraflavitalea sp. CAU 1676]MDF2193481.1 IPT/TIG domain-containing protein [Paraflavitalea sp. CAU 1676]